MVMVLKLRPVAVAMATTRSIGMKRAKVSFEPELWPADPKAYCEDIDEEA